MKLLSGEAFCYKNSPFAIRKWRPFASFSRQAINPTTVLRSFLSNLSFFSFAEFNKAPDLSRWPRLSSFLLIQPERLQKDTTIITFRSFVVASVMHRFTKSKTLATFGLLTVKNLNLTLFKNSEREKVNNLNVFQYIFMQFWQVHNKMKSCTFVFYPKTVV